MNTSSWLNPHLEKRNSDAHGWGIFAKADIRKDERLAIFGGKVMLIDEMYQIPLNMQAYTMQIEERFVLGPASTVPEDTDFFNHSCDPNSGFRGQVFLVAIRDIKAGEEITFDYGMTVSVSVGSDMVFEMECACGSPHCRKTITEQDWMLPELQVRYKGYFSQYIQDRIERLNENSFGVLVNEEVSIPDNNKAELPIR
ncbi:MAG: SET domain-containing protein [Methanoregula sp.]|nr:SET domain-containing protein [Methanoregula sp.]